MPSVGPARPIRVPTAAERKLRNGLRVLAIRRPTVPRVEIRLRMPAGLIHDGGQAARAWMLPETILTGTRSRSSVDIAQELQGLGAGLEAAADADDLVVSVGCLSASLERMLDLMAEVVTAPTFPADEVDVARDRVVQELIIGRSQPSVIARETWRAQLFGRHGYGRPMPAPETIARTGPAQIRRFHAERVLPRGSTLVLVGDIRPEQAVEAAAEAFRGWKGRPVTGATPAPTMSAPESILLVDRPGAVQTNIRLAGAALPRGHKDYFALTLANLVFGGYFSSRLVTNIRETKGYTYSPGSAVDHRRGASALVVGADVGTEVTAAALLEIRYELGRMAALEVDPDELDAARRYLAGVTSLSIQTQAGLAGYVDTLISCGLSLDYLRTFQPALQRITTHQILEISRKYLGPGKLLTVLVGDAGAIRAQAEAFGPVEVRNAP
ncbi:MAG: pitrilysin family protein [Actinomycetota bacterium]